MRPYRIIYTTDTTILPVIPRSNKMQTKLEVDFYLYLSEQTDKNIICALWSLIEVIRKHNEHTDTYLYIYT